jgi:hypothetical protein
VAGFFSFLMELSATQTEPGSGRVNVPAMIIRKRSAELPAPLSQGEQLQGVPEKREISARREKF